MTGWFGPGPVRGDPGLLPGGASPPPDTLQPVLRTAHISFTLRLHARPVAVNRQSVRAF